MRLKLIFSSINITKYLEEIKKYFTLSHFNYIVFTLSKFLACRDSLKGFVIYECPNCFATHKFTITCKSRFCPTCGFTYSSKWAEKTSKSMIYKKHRHILFTIPKECREFFMYDRELLVKLSDAVNDIMKYHFNNISPQNKRAKKLVNILKSSLLLMMLYIMDWSL